VHDILINKVPKLYEDSSDPAIQHHLGIYYVDHIMIDTAKTYFKKAMDQNYIYSIGAYAYYIINDDTSAESIYLYKKAADLNNTCAQTRYADILYKMKRNDEAKLYYVKAINNGCEYAYSRYICLLLSEKKMDLNLSLIKQLCKQSWTELGSEWAKYKLDYLDFNQKIENAII
jgi:tetratricopeptide (TPR) repeat protein